MVLIPHFPAELYYQAGDWSSPEVMVAGEHIETSKYIHIRRPQTQRGPKYPHNTNCSFCNYVCFTLLFPMWLFKASLDNLIPGPQRGFSACFASGAAQTASRLPGSTGMGCYPESPLPKGSMYPIIRYLGFG